MASEWRDMSLGEFVVLQRGHDLTDSERRPGRVPVMGSAGQNGYHDTVRSKGPGVVIGRSGASFGQVHLSVEDFWPHNTTLYVTDFLGNDPKFVFYFLKSIDFGSYNSGSAQASLNRNFLYPIRVRVPQPEEQKRIAHILGTLDDKIELNRRMNATLEAMARALFQSWFVDFDPVRAKAAGQTPAGMNPATAALFPSEFEDSEMGEIPKGWEVSPLGDHLDVLETGRRPKGGVSGISAGVPSVGAESIWGIGQFDFGKTKFIPEEFYARTTAGRVMHNDVLLYKDGGKPGVFKPRVGMFGHAFPFDRFCINEHVFRMRSTALGQFFLYFTVSHQRVLDDYANKGGKAAIPGINQSDARSVRVLVPSPSVLKTFDNIVGPLCDLILQTAKPMHGHGLMQAIARVNRVFKDKPGGLVVDYIGIGAELKSALRTYTDAKGKGQPTVRAEDGLRILREKMDIIRGMMHGCDYEDFDTSPLTLLVPVTEHLLGLPDGKKRFLDVMASVTRAYSLCATLDEAAELEQEIAFFTAVRAVIVKNTVVDRKRTEEAKNSALKQILDNAILSEGVTDIFKLAGVERPNIGLLSDEFLEDVRKMPAKNLAVELLERLMRDEIKASTRGNIVQERKYSDRLLEALRKYHNRAIETKAVIEELIAMAKDFKAAVLKNASMGLNADEIAFYDALAERPQVLEEMSDKTLKDLAVELTAKLRQSTSVDWQVRESVRAQMRLLIKRLLRKYKYPPEGQEAAVEIVIEQAERLSEQWSESRA